VSRHGRAQLVAHDADGLLRLGLFAGGYAHKATGHKAEGLDNLVLFLIEELGHAADKLAVFVHAEPIRLGAGLDFGIRAYLVYLLAGESAARHHHGLDLIAVGKGRKVQSPCKTGDVPALQIYAQIRLV